MPIAGGGLAKESLFGDALWLLRILKDSKGFLRILADSQGFLRRQTVPPALSVLRARAAREQGHQALEVACCALALSFAAATLAPSLCPQDAPKRMSN